MPEIVRCPYCVLANEFRPMVERPGWYICERCGHTILNDDPQFKCRCQRCEPWASMTRCQVVEVSNLADAAGIHCGKVTTQHCSDCGIAICLAHTETCQMCSDAFCPSCLSFHLTQERHLKPRNRRTRETTAKDGVVTLTRSLGHCLLAPDLSAHPQFQTLRCHRHVES
jgi:hypothetical protein